MPDLDEKIMSTRILDLMKSNNFSYYDLEEKTGYSRSTLQRYIVNKPGQMSMKMMSMLADIFNVSISYLMVQTDDPINYDTIDVSVPKDMWPNEDEEDRIRKYLKFKDAEKRDALQDQDIGNLNPKQEQTIQVIRRASEKMSDSDLDKMVGLLNLAFEDAFKDDDE